MKESDFFSRLPGRCITQSGESGEEEGCDEADIFDVEADVYRSQAVKE